MAKKYLIETFGCQMNMHDSERMAGLLEQAGYEPTDADTDADIVVINTLSGPYYGKVLSVSGSSASTQEVALADVITPNRNEAAVLTGVSEEEATRDPAAIARRLVRDGAAGDAGAREAAIVTLGGAGALLVRADAPDRPVPLPPHVVEPVDTTGAGDAFVEIGRAHV